MIRPVLRWIARASILVGAILLAWSANGWMTWRESATIPIPLQAAQQHRLRDATETPKFDRPGPMAAPARSRIAPGTWLARLESPSVHLQTTVFEGSDDRTLSKGAGHVEGTALPGPSGNIGIAGHRDTVFRPLRNLQLGAELRLTTSDRVYRYRVVRTEIVDPHEVWVLGPMPQPTLTLVTCYPFNLIGHAPRRFVVHGELIGSEPR